MIKLKEIKQNRNLNKMKENCLLIWKKKEEKYKNMKKKKSKNQNYLNLKNKDKDFKLIQKTQLCNNQKKVNSLKSLFLKNKQ